MTINYNQQKGPDPSLFFLFLFIYLFIFGQNKISPPNQYHGLDYILQI